jgi:hypothetical protein
MFFTEKSSTNLLVNYYFIQTFLCCPYFNLGLFRHLQDAVSRANSLVLLKAFQKNVDVRKKYGPEVSIRYIKCLGELAVVCAWLVIIDF